MLETIVSRKRNINQIIIKKKIKIIWSKIAFIRK